jgi:TldD protein
MRGAWENVYTRERQITGVSASESYGIGIRALVGGSWGFAATGNVTRESVVAAAREAAAIARANDRINPVETLLAPVQPVADGRWVTPHEVDPFTVPVEDKAALLFRVNEEALKVPGVRFVNSGVSSVRDSRLLGTTDGSMIEQTFYRIYPFVNVTAVSDDNSDFQSRDAALAPMGAGWEYVTELNLVQHVPRWAEEAVMKLSAPSVEAGQWDLVLHPSHLWLTLHESIGHPTELDRARGFEANYAGTSFLAPPEAVLSKFRYGPDFMQVQGNRTEAGGLATCAWDDEGVPAREWAIVRNGVFVNYQTTRESASWIAEQTGLEASTGCAYGEGWWAIPFQRMPNISLLPNAENLSDEDVIAATDRGIFIEGHGSYSIDQQRYNFQFGGQTFWEIRNGRRTRMLRDVAYQGRTPEFWNSLALIGGRQTYRLGGTFNDGKGQPPQSNAVSHGCPMALFRNVNVLSTA